MNCQWWTFFAKMIVAAFSEKINQNQSVKVMKIWDIPNIRLLTEVLPTFRSNSVKSWLYLIKSLLISLNCQRVNRTSNRRLSPTRKELYCYIIPKHSSHNLKQVLTTKKSPTSQIFWPIRPKTLFKKEAHPSLFFRQFCNILLVNYSVEHMWTAAFVFFVKKRTQNDICESLGSSWLHKQICKSEAATH